MLRLPLRHCWGASSLISLAADAVQWAAAEAAGAGDEDGGGVGTEYCPERERRGAHSTAVTALAAALMFPGLHSHAYGLQKHLGKVSVFIHLGFQGNLFKSFYNQISSTKTKKWLQFGFQRKQMFSDLASNMVMIMMSLPYLHNDVNWHQLDA